MIQSARNQLLSNRPQIVAWSIHLFTASGALWGLLAILAIVQHQWQAAFLWMAVAVAVDGLDGTLARRFRVVGMTPDFDGALLDNIIDYETYVVVPALLIYEAGLLPPPLLLAGVAIVLLSSAFQFCQADAKTDDYAFKGFPSYWNVLVFYLFMFTFAPWLNFVIVLACAVLVFVPVKYLYPSRMNRYRGVTVAATAVWGLLVLVVLLRYPQPSPGLLWLSLLYAVYYVGLSLYLMRKTAVQPGKPPTF